MVNQTDANGYNPTARLVQSFAVADMVNVNFKDAIQNGFESYVQTRAKDYGAKDADVIAAAKFVVGRTFRTSANGPPETITADRYLQILDKTHLRSQI